MNSSRNGRGRRLVSSAHQLGMAAGMAFLGGLLARGMVVVALAVGIDPFLVPEVNSPGGSGPPAGPTALHLCPWAE